MSQVQLISECFIRPKCEAEQSPMRMKYHLGPLDFSMLSLSYLNIGNLYAKKPSSIKSLLAKLKVSLSLVLVHFYPLAGQLVTERYEEEHSCCIYIDCGKGPGVRFIHAATKAVEVGDIIGVDSEFSTPVKPCHVFHTTEVPLFISSFFDLGKRATNHDGHNRPLLSIQVTELVDGVFLGCSINHCVVDGTSYTHFMSMWSEIFLNVDNNCPAISLSCLPNYKRPIPDGYGPIVKLPYLEPNEFIVPYEDVIQLRKRIFHFSAASMKMLKAKANAQCDGVNCGSNDGTQNISSLQALSALLWRSITRSRNLHSGETTTCGLVANLRPRFEPPLSDDYFGIFMTATKATVAVGELLCHDLGWAAKLLHQAVVSLDDKTSLHVYLQPFVKGPLILRPNLGSQGPNPVLISGSPRFNLYGLDFALGRAVAVRTGYAEKANGSVMAYPGREGGGSVDLDVCLPADTMTALLSDVELLEFEG